MNENANSDNSVTGRAIGTMLGAGGAVGIAGGGIAAAGWGIKKTTEGFAGVGSGLKKMGGAIKEDAKTLKSVAQKMVNPDHDMQNTELKSRQPLLERVETGDVDKLKQYGINGANAVGKTLKNGQKVNSAVGTIGSSPVKLKTNPRIKGKLHGGQSSKEFMNVARKVTNAIK